MTKRYKVIITPIEPYTFGTEQGSKFEGADVTGKENYIIGSAFTPEQTTVLGALRLIVLKQKGPFNENFKYSKEEKEKMAENIGAKSFSFEGEKENFGLIKSISPVFITGRGVNYVPNPYCNKEKESGFTPYAIEEKAVCTSKGNINLPGDNYDVKKGHGYGYIGLSSEHKLIGTNDLFSVNVLSGNKANHEKNEKDTFFKREVVTFAKDYTDFAFAVYVEAEEGAFPESAIGYMGRKQSAFSFEFAITNDEAIEDQISNSLKAAGKTWFYAASDIYAPKMKIEGAFAMAELKKIRNLETVIDADKYVGKRRKSEKQIYLIKAGSVFLSEPDTGVDNSKYTQIGYNRIVRIGE